MRKIIFLLLDIHWNYTLEYGNPSIERYVRAYISNDKSIRCMA